ncbi:MAG: dTDP-4-dehydrorhamnose reductase [Desulfobacterales bacterium]|nr:dTDP-4-dehydrorhamnose reductase [Desulfobacterales bacterium]|tara:strand:+ start:537 stop:1424 length:888 start_codon:yes stop_codon:yes gene_type:complete
MKIITFGSKGQLGHELVKQGNRFAFEILPFDLPEVDITNPFQVENIVSTTPATLVVNAAAYTNVDRAETEKTPAFAVNRDGPENIAQSCERKNIPLIHISTDYVFNGKTKYPYTEADQVSPLGVYGHSKSEGEKKIRSQIKRHIIIRTSWLYGVCGHNFVKTMLGLGNENSRLKVVSDQFGSPTSAADLAETVLTIGRQIQNSIKIDWGTYHYCGLGTATWHLFAEKIFQIAKQYTPLRIETVEPIKTDEYPTPAERPMYSVLDCSRIEQRLGIHPKPWEESLHETIARMMKKGG